MAVTAIANRKYQKQKPTKLSVGAKIHNRFDFYINDKPVAYGESEYQVGMAENIVLDQMYTRLCARSSYFVNIHFGTGTGTLSAARTSLFTHLGTKTAVNDAQSKALPTSWWRQKIVLNPEEYVGSALSEVGVAYGSTSTNLVTHALIKDINGNPITLTKTALDVVTIYATVYVTFSTSNTNLGLIGMRNTTNALVNYLIGNSSFPSTYFWLGASSAGLTENDPSIASGSYGQSSILTWTADPTNKKMYTNTYRFDINTGNGHITEVGTQFSRLILPAPGIYSGLVLENVPIGVGDGETFIFIPPSRNIDTSSISIKIDGIVVSPQPEKELSLITSGPNNYYMPSSYGYEGNLRHICTSYDKSIIMTHSDGNQCHTRFFKKFGDVYHYLSNSGPGGSYRYTPSAAISGNGQVACFSYEFNGFYTFSIFEISEIGNFTARVNPSNLVNSVSGYSSSRFRSSALNNDGSVLALIYNASPYLHIFDWDGSSWTKRTNVTPSITQVPQAVSVSSDGQKVAALYSSSNEVWVDIFYWIDSSWTKSKIQLQSVGGVGYDIFINPELTTFAVMFSNTSSGLLFMEMHKLNESIWSKIGSSVSVAKHSSLSLSNGRVSFSPDESIMAMSAYDQTVLAKFNVDWSIVSNSYLGSIDGKVSQIIDNSLLLYGSDSYSILSEIDQKDTQITFASPPANGAVITADYTVNGIHKTAQRVIDLYAEITFGEVT